MLGTNGSSSSQLMEMQGTMKLSYPLLSDLGCLLTILEEHGCRGNVMFQYLPPELVTQWRSCLSPGRPLRVKIDSHPVLDSIELNGIVGEILDHSSHCEIELRFSQLTPEQKAILQKAVGRPEIVQGVTPAAAVPKPPTSASGRVLKEPPVLAQAEQTPAAEPPPPPPPPRPQPMVPRPQPTPARAQQAPPSFTIFKKLKDVQPALGSTGAAAAPGGQIIFPISAPPPPPPHANTVTQQPTPAAPPPARPLPPSPAAAYIPAPPPPPSAAPAPLAGIAPVAVAPAPAAVSSSNQRPFNSVQPPQAVAGAPGWPYPRPAGTAMIPPRPGMPNLIPQRPGSTNLPPRSGQTNLLPASNKKKLGAVLVQMGYLTTEQIDEAVKQAHIKGQRIGRYLVSSGMISPDILCRSLALQSGLPVTDLSDVEISEEIAKLFPYPLMMRHSFLPFDDCAMFVCIAVSTPLTHATLNELERTCNKKVEVFLAREDLILKHLNDIRKREAGGQPRRFIRYKYKAPVNYTFCNRFAGPSEDAVYSGITHNISEGGMLIEGPGSTLGAPAELLRRGICLRVTMGDGATEVKALCRFKNIQEKNGLWFMGLELLEISAEDRRRLKELCVKAMVQQMNKQ